MRQLSNDEIKRVELDILIAFSEYCERHDLKYYLTYGTLIGAVRHQGFIPWDDDIDVAMVRSDYEKLIECTKTDKIGEHYYFRSGDTGTWDEPIGKIVDDRTIAYDDHSIGLWIDIFPLDYYDQKTHDECVRLRKVILAKKSKELVPNTKKNVVKLLIKYLTFFIPVTKVTKTVIRKATHIPKCEYVGNIVFSAANVDKLSKEELEQCYVKYEGYEFTTFKAYDKYLSMLYGDYMKLPPEDQRKGHELVAYFL